MGSQGPYILISRAAQGWCDMHLVVKEQDCSAEATKACKGGISGPAGWLAGWLQTVWSYSEMVKTKMCGMCSRGNPGLR